MAIKISWLKLPNYLKKLKLNRQFKRYVFCNHGYVKLQSRSLTNFSQNSSYLSLSHKKLTFYISRIRVGLTEIIKAEQPYFKDFPSH